MARSFSSFRRALGTPCGRVAATSNMFEHALRYMQWSPVPKRPWGVHESSGRIIRRFDTAVQATAYLIKWSRIVDGAVRKTKLPAAGEP